MKNGSLIFFLIGLFLACGDSKIEVQSPLLVVDTYPSSGAEVDPSLSDILVFFSSRIDSASLSNDSFVLELIGEIDTTVAGAKVSTEVLDISEDGTSVHIVIKETPLKRGSIYRLTISNVKSVFGDKLSQSYYKFFKVR
ncbi:MAG: Ig-like domain-containing protein [Deltaproteobacteria bacterium]|nr:Ig-like domain-containing protein [Deltaproteobacteria bacterium]